VAKSTEYITKSIYTLALAKGWASLQQQLECRVINTPPQPLSNLASVSFLWLFYN